METLAIITARGGSKRIPRKNIKDFCGKPIIAYSIEAAIESGLFSEVMVSTDSEEIADVARRYGASVPFMRSERTSDDYATTHDVLKEVLQEYGKRDKNYDIFACLYPTAPFVTARKLIDAYELIKKEEADAVYPVVKYSFPPQRAFIIKDGFLKYQYPENINKRSQDLEPIYHDCGQFYFKRARNILNDIAEEKRIPFIVNEMEVQDIDNEEDWKIAEIKYQSMIVKK
ncbi:MAG: pseudaminic acid cytidylyltransferase [Lachnospiraceae bacterium]|nr:pseudaminic acid cytidylyltransferase [Lachnospiraceae bacterium]